MSISYHSCECCNKSYILDHCKYRIIDDDRMRLCDWCLTFLLENKEWIELDKYSKDYENLSSLEKENIIEYDSIYKITNKGIKERVKKLTIDVKISMKEIKKLLQKTKKEGKNNENFIFNRRAKFSWQRLYCKQT